MVANIKAIEVSGEIDEERQLHLDEPLPVSGPSRVRVIILMHAHGQYEPRSSQSLR